MSRLTNQLTVKIAGLRGPGLSSDDLAAIEGATNEAVRSAGFDTLAAASAFAPKIPTGKQTIVRETDTGTHVAVAGEVRLDGTAATVGELVPNEGSYTKQAGGALWRTASTERQQAKASADIAQLQASYEQTLGRPLSATPAVGTSTLGANVYVFADTLTKDGEIYRLRLRVAAAGSVTLSRWTRSGTTNTRVVGGDVTIAFADTGLKDIALKDLPTFKPLAGEMVGVYGPGIVATSSATAADGAGFYSGANGASFTSATPTTTTRIEMGLTLGSISPDRYVEQRFERVEGLVNSPLPKQTIGKTTPITSGVTASPNRTWVLGPVISRTGLLSQINGNRLTAGQVYVSVCDKVGDVFTQDAAAGEIVIDLPAGSDPVKVTEPFIGIAGKRVMLWCTTGMLCHVTGDPEGAAIGYYDNGGTNGKVTSFTDSAILTTTTLQIGFEFDPSTDAIRKALLDVGGGDPGEDYSGVTPTGYILVWGLGQSNKAGRAPTRSGITLEAGQAYKYVRSATNLQLMADPTGNDATALADGGKGSSGPALARTIQRLSKGKIGVIFVNSALGGQSIVPGLSGLNAWASGGSARTQAVTDLAAALADAATKKLPIVGACATFMEGETAAGQGVSSADYKPAWANFQAWVATNIGTNVPIIMDRIGTGAAPEPAGFAVIRQAQDEIAEDQSNVYMAHTGARYFRDRGLMIDDLHFNLQAQEEIGEAEGNAIFGVALGRRPKGHHG